jgi:(aminoalkyl)phosphonate N-acetyltransferase
VTITIREARDEDFRAVAALLEELGRPKVLGTGAQSESAHRERYQQWLSEPGFFAFVAEQDGAVVGFVDLQIVPRLNFDGPQAWVPDLIVTEGCRSRGVGAALLARTEEVARQLGAFSLALESAHWRTRAHEFYLREGMKDAALEFVKVLTDVDWPPSPPVRA